MEKEAEVFGQRTISGFLSQIGAEEAMAADQVIWSEQGRLHLSYKGCAITGNIITIGTDVDGNSIASGDHAVRVGDMILVSAASGTASVVAHVTLVSVTTVTAVPYEIAGTLLAATGATSGTTDVSCLVIGSEFDKGDNYSGSAARTANEPSFAQFSNQPIIMKDFYQVSGSDTSRIGWVEVTGEEGQNGYLWYL